MERYKKFEITCDDSGQFYVNGNPVERRGSGWRQRQDKTWYYSKKANVIDRLGVAIENGEVSREEVENCRSHEERQELWNAIKVKRGRGLGSGGKGINIWHPDPFIACWNAIEHYSKEQPVNTKGSWYGNTICFTGQMYDRDGNKIVRSNVRKIANNLGFIWLENVNTGCVFLITGEYCRWRSKPA